MESIKAFSIENTHFILATEDSDLVIDAVQTVVFWNETPPGAPLSERYRLLSEYLSKTYEYPIDIANAYLILEKAASIVAALKKTLLSSPK